MQQQISRIVSGAHKQDRYSSADNAAVMAVLAVAGGGVGGGGGTNRSGGAPPACASVRIGGQTWSQTARREYARRPDGLMCHQKSCPFQHRDDVDYLRNSQKSSVHCPPKLWKIKEVVFDIQADRESHSRLPGMGSLKPFLPPKPQIGRAHV